MKPLRHILQNRRKDKAGFTLVETLLALSITAIIIVMLSVVFNTGLRSYRQGKDLIDITKKAQFVIGTMTREMSGVLVSGNVISFEATDNGNSDSVYFMAPVNNSSPLDLCEIGYSHDNSKKELRRYLRTFGSTDFEYPGKVIYPNVIAGNIFCTNVEEFNLRYYDGNNWQNSWSSFTQLPQIVEVRLKIMGEYGSPLNERIFTTWIYLPN